MTYLPRDDGLPEQEGDPRIFKMDHEGVKIDNFCAGYYLKPETYERVMNEAGFKDFKWVIL